MELLILTGLIVSALTEGSATMQSELCWMEKRQDLKPYGENKFGWRQMHCGLQGCDALMSRVVINILEEPAVSTSQFQKRTV
jgi:hypothetical protein